MNSATRVRPGPSASDLHGSQPAHGESRHDFLVSALTFTALAVLVRLQMFGLPAFQSDEQFYLLVGQRMAEGALPFVDIWDRKPIGLFLIYRAAVAIPLDPVLAYQLLGTASSVMTALVIERTARLIAPPRGARLSGIAYLLYQCVFNVALGQSPVFYNLPVACAGLMTVRVCIERQPNALSRQGLAIMLLLGLAMQIKYSALFEGIAMGLMLLERAWQDRTGPRRLTTLAVLWIGAALLPTATAFAWYLRAGHAEAFIQANFLSIFGREDDAAKALVRLGKETLAMAPLLLAVLSPARTGLRDVQDTAHALRALRIWTAAAMFGFLALGTWYDHYLGPVLVPVSILAAPALARACRRRNAVLGLGLLGAFAVPACQVRERGNAAQFRTLSATIARELHGRCLYVHEGDSALYRTTGACIPTRYAYPSHLNARNEAGALGVDPVAEVDRLMATYPGVVVLREGARPNQPNRQTSARLNALLAKNYERYAEVPVGTRRYALYRFKPKG